MALTYQNGKNRFSGIGFYANKANNGQSRTKNGGKYFVNCFNCRNFARDFHKIVE